MGTGQGWANTQYFNPRHIANLSLWIDATDPAANGVVPSDGTALSTWVDKSGTGNNATQASGSAQPTFKLNIQNGKPAVLFNGSSQFMSGTIAALSGNPSYSVLYVEKLSGFADHTAWGFGSNTGNNQSIGGGYGAGAGSFNHFQWGTGEADFSPGNTNTNYISCLKNSDNTRSIWVNASPQTSSSGAATALSINTTYTVGSFSRTGTPLYWSDYIMEMIVYTQQLSTANRLLVQNYLKNKWGL